MDSTDTDVDSVANGSRTGRLAAEFADGYVDRYRALERCDAANEYHYRDQDFAKFLAALDESIQHQ
ncbi:hypothetical protein [Nocardia nepalensis]|uniref:hypothetical protein n=1 Tax=Nocardia nepalensis TaxID=3375448 RepID=UPI003B68052C